MASLTHRGRRAAQIGVLVVVSCLAASGIADAGATPDSRFQGRLRIVHADAPFGSETTYWLESAGTTRQLSLDEADAPGPNTRVEVAGVRDGATIDVDSIEETGPPPSPGPSGNQRILIMLAGYSPQDAVTSTSAEQQIGQVDSDWYRGTSYGAAWLTATATPWMTIPDRSVGGTTCKIYGIFSDAEAAAVALGFNPSAYDREMVYVPHGSPGCTQWAGQAEVGGRRSWIYGYMDTRVTVHELGHNLGLWHSHSLTCHNGSGANVTYGSTCDPIDEYGDPFDAMGNCCFSTPGQFSALQKDNLGWMSQRVQDISAAGSTTVTLTPLEGSSVGVQGLRVQSGSTVYWLDLRQPLGEDAYLSSHPGATQGVEIHIADAQNGTDLLDSSPNGDFFTEVLPFGASWTTPEGVRITVGSLNASGVPVTVVIPGPQGCTIFGTGGDDIISGTAGNDVICAGGGNDKIFATTGNDVVNGGTGVDLVTFVNATAAVRVNLLAGTATGWGTDQLAGIENVTGSPFADDIKGNALPNILAGWKGNDKVAGNGGDDTLQGGPGNDTLMAPSGNVLVDGQTGQDTVSFVGSKRAVVVNLGAGTASGPGLMTILHTERVIGSKFADRIKGAPGPNTLNGEGGNDKINSVDGTKGNDSIDGGAGRDTCTGDASDKKTHCP